MGNFIGNLTDLIRKESVVEHKGGRGKILVLEKNKDRMKSLASTKQQNYDAEKRG